MKIITRIIAAALVGLTLGGCMHRDDTDEEAFDASQGGLFICNEGNFQYSNGTLSYYNPGEAAVENEVFYRANGFRLGDVVQSMTAYGGRGWIVVNNSQVVFAIDLTNFREIGRIDRGLTSPRYIHFVSDEKAYITQLWDNRIAIANPKTMEVTGYIQVPDMTMESGSTEQMVSWGKYVICTCWSYQNRIIKIDTSADRVVAEAEVGIQPNSIVLDARGKLWVLTDGGYQGSPYGYEGARLMRIDPATLKIERTFRFALKDSPAELTLNGAGDRIYWLNDDVWSMSVDAQSLPVRPTIKSQGTKYYGLTVSPINGDIYVADAIDYQQKGIIYRYEADGTLIGHFYVGVTPGAFCWNY